MLQLLRYFLPFKRLLLLAVLCNVLMSLFMVISIPALLPFLQILFNRMPASAGYPPEGLQWHTVEAYTNWFFAELIRQHGREQALGLVCFVLVLIFLGKNLFRYLSLYFLAPVRNGLVRDLRQQFIQKSLALPLAFFSEERKGDLMSRMTSDVQEIEWSIIGVMEAVVREPIVILGSLAVMIAFSPTLTLFVLTLLLFAGVVIGRLGRNLRQQSGQAQQQFGALASLIEETLGGLRIIKGFNAEAYQRARFFRENSVYAALQTRIYRRRDLASPLSEFLGISVVAVLLWFGSARVFAGSLSAETFITFLYAFYNVIDPAKAFASALYSIRKGMGALERVQRVLDTPLQIQDAPDALPVEQFKDAVEFRNVSFQYANAERPAVQDINIRLPRGKIIALVGASGAGKSTLADLLPRFYDVQDGAILLDGVDIRQLRLKDLRAQMGIVSQEAILFNDTVANNIAFGNANSTIEDIERAAMAANAHDFITALPEGYHTNIGDRGTKLSGGQRQRLTIARALLKNPPILILDEATSALDSESEKLVQTALDRLLANRTALVIAHRLSTIQHANEILVLDAGRIIERGTHEQLMARGQAYRRLVDLQAL
jgi:ABC-type multidrug transport system fused ATPase/permease subunit